jgi:hypothetical protein
MRLVQYVSEDCVGISIKTLIYIDFLLNIPLSSKHIHTLLVNSLNGGEPW